MRAKSLILLVGVATLAGCSQGGGPPARKAGLWEQTLQGDLLPAPLVSRVCLDAASERLTPVMGRRPRAACAKYALSRGPGGAYVLDTVCQSLSGAKVTGHSVASGDFASRYQVVSRRTIENAPDPDMNGQHSTSITAVYKGPCPATMKPGQVQLPSGEIVDIGRVQLLRRPPQ
jgi:hypothetical protein